MISKIKVKNFQKHKTLEVEFDAGVTTLVGPSRAGKTAIFRALLWAGTNRPAGAGFVRHGAAGCAVTLTVDGRAVKRHRLKGPRNNGYKLDAEAYAALGGKVPDAVAGLLRVGDVNFQRQLDAPFWFTDPPAVVSKKLNKVVNLDAIDATLAAVGAVVRKKKAELAVCRQRLRAAKAKREELAWVPGCVADFNVMQQLWAAGQNAWGEWTELDAALQGVRRAAATRDRAGAPLKLGRRAVLLGKKAASCGKAAGKLRELLKELRVADEARQAVPDVAPLLKVRQWADGVAEDRGGLAQLITALKHVKRNKKCHASELEHLLPQLKNCPACGRPQEK